MRHLRAEIVSRLLGIPAGTFRQQVHMGLYGGLGDAKGFTLTDYALIALAHKLRDPGLPLGTAWQVAGGFLEPLAMEMAEAAPHSAIYAIVPHGGPDAPCTVPAEDLREAMLDLLQSSSTVTVINLSEVGETIMVEWAVATGRAAELEQRGAGNTRLAELIAAARTKLAAGNVRVTADGALAAEREPA